MGPKRQRVAGEGSSSRVFVATPNSVGLSREESSLWDDLDKPKRKVFMTRFLDVPTLRVLGMESVVRRMLRKVGLEGFMDKSAPTYNHLTLEFLATMTTVNVHNRGPEIQFKLLGRNHVMTYAALREAFGIEERAGQPYEGLHAARTSLFWYDITQKHVRRKGDKSYTIPHPCLRLVHRLLTNTFYCQGEQTNISRAEMRFLWSMTPDGEGVPDWVDIFVKSCIKIQSAKEGKIGMGGMVSLIATHLGVQIPQSMPSLGDDFRMNIGKLVAMDLLRETGIEGRYIWCWGPDHVHYLRLPRPAGAELPYGPSAQDFFIPPDQGVGLNMELDSNEEQQEEEADESDDNEESSAKEIFDDVPFLVSHPPLARGDIEGRLDRMMRWMDQASDWMAGSDDRMASYGDQFLETREITRTLGRLALARYPNQYTPPGADLGELLTGRATARVARARERQVRRNARRGRAGPSDS